MSTPPPSGAHPYEDIDERGGEDGARAAILDRVRAALGASPATVEVPREYQHRGEHEPGSAAARGMLAHRLADYRAEVRGCAESAIPASVAAALRDHRVRLLVVPAGLPADWLSAADGVEHLIDSPEEPLDIADLDRSDGVLTGCAVAIAETGTIVLDAADGQGRRALTLVPDLHIVVVRAEQVVQSVPEAVARMSPRRPLTMISGPSATSDIELNRVEGVHGPRTLVVILASPG
jgi:L-lactate dehydrogenase complex protein LldG